MRINPFIRTFLFIWNTDCFVMEFSDVFVTLKKIWSVSLFRPPQLFFPKSKKVGGENKQNITFFGV